MRSETELRFKIENPWQQTIGGLEILVACVIFTLVARSAVEGRPPDAESVVLAFAVFIAPCELLRRPYHIVRLNHVDLDSTSLTETLWMVWRPLKVRYEEIESVELASHDQILTSRFMGLSFQRPAGNVHVILKRPQHMYEEPSSAFAFFEPPGRRRLASVLCLRLDHPTDFIEGLQARIGELTNSASA
ncbi:MAG TPA: hypothetical protein VH951_10535 [Dehalococcoidia bacterium]